MAEKSKNAKRKNPAAGGKPGGQNKIISFISGIGKRLRNFFISLKAELKRVIWPDRKRLIQSTATVLAICVMVGIILFVVDSLVGGLLNTIGFYSDNAATPTPRPTAPTTAVTTTMTTTIAETTAAETLETTSAG